MSVPLPARHHPRSRFAPPGTTAFIFFYQAGAGIRYLTVTGVQTCALPISPKSVSIAALAADDRRIGVNCIFNARTEISRMLISVGANRRPQDFPLEQIE